MRKVFLFFAVIPITALLLGLGAGSLIARAESISIKDFVELLIVLDVIPKDKAEQARSFATSQAEESAFVFTRDLSLGKRGTDVVNLQGFLNSESATRLAGIGPGSPGNETDFFGPLTHAAVIRFQEKYAADVLVPVGLSSGTGFFGPSTRKKANALLAAKMGEGATEEIAMDEPLIEEEILSDDSLSLLAFESDVPVVFFPSRYDGVSETSVTLTGAGFTRTGNEIQFGDVRIENLESVDGQTLTFEIPNLPAGRYDIMVINAQGESDTIALTITVADAVPPVIESLSPTSGTTGTVVTIRGSGFTPTGNTIYTGYDTIENVPSEDGVTLAFVMRPPGVAGDVLAEVDSDTHESVLQWEFSDELRSLYPQYFASGEALVSAATEFFSIYVENNNGFSNKAVFEYRLK